ncbi:MAG: hypothetical protein IPJ17_09565 [Holophagales bacterium]|nr:MAG: hypothetical protein IPJ17_09565 [Holophagales bacterium]
MLVDALLTLANLAIWGCHGTIPWLAASRRAEWRRPWSLAAAPLLLASLLATASWIGTTPDAALAQNLAGQASAGTLARLLALFVIATLAGDLLLLAAWRRMEPAAWRLLGALGAITLLFVSAAGDRLRIGEGPSAGSVGLAIAWLVRLLLALAAAEILTGPRLAAPAAGAALPIFWLALAPTIRATIAAEGTYATLAVASLALLVSRWLPAHFRRATVVAGLLLAVLFFARAHAVPLEQPQRTQAPSATAPG